MMSLRTRKLALPITLAAIALGFLISLQVETHKNVSAAEKLNEERLASIKTVILNAQNEHDSLQKEHQELGAKLDQARNQGTDPSVVSQLAQMSMMDGTSAVEGPGIEILIDDRSQDHKVVFPIVSDDLIKIVNVLRFARAEAISINGQRIVGTTAIVYSGTSTILINQVPINRTEGTPYVIQAIGDQATLADYFTKLKASELREGGKTVSVTQKTVKIPSYKGNYTFSVAQPATP